MQDSNPRYYKEIPLVPQRTSAVQEEHSHWHYSADLLTGRISGSFVALQLLHVSTGQIVPPESLGLQDDAPLVKEFYRAAGNITIPATSLKGPVRSVVEMISYSAVSKTKERFTGAEKGQYAENTYNARQHRGGIDVAGKLFGAMGYQGQVSFADAPLIDGRMLVHDIPPQYKPKIGDGRRFYPHHLQDPRDRLWPLEVAAEGSRFGVDIQFTNLAAAELGLLLIPLGMTVPSLCIKVGAGKSSGLGAIRFENIAVQQFVSAESYSTLDSVWAPIDTASCVDDAVRTLVRSDNALAILQANLGCSEWDAGEESP